MLAEHFKATLLDITKGSYVHYGDVFPKKSGKTSIGNAADCAKTLATSKHLPLIKFTDECALPILKRELEAAQRCVLQPKGNPRTKDWEGNPQRKLWGLSECPAPEWKQEEKNQAKLPEAAEHDSGEPDFNSCSEDESEPEPVSDSDGEVPVAEEEDDSTVVDLDSD